MLELAAKHILLNYFSHAALLQRLVCGWLGVMSQYKLQLTTTCTISGH